MHKDSRDGTVVHHKRRFLLFFTLHRSTLHYPQPPGLEISIAPISILPQHPPHLLHLLLRKQRLRPLPLHKIMIRKFKARHHSLTNQTPILTILPILRVRQEVRRFVLPPFYNELKLLPTKHILPNNIRLHPRLASPELLLVRSTLALFGTVAAGSGAGSDFVGVDDHVACPAFVQGVHCAAAVAVESSEGRGGGEEVVDCGAGGAGGGVLVGGGSGGVGCCWTKC
jgi:hypothetical protein